MESDEIKERESLNTKVAELKCLNLDTFAIGNYVDIMNIETRSWCVGQIVERSADMIKVHYEGFPEKFDETVSIKKEFKIQHFRRFSKGYTGIKRAAARNYTFNVDDLRHIELNLKNFADDNFQSLILKNPIEITQLLRGKIFTYIDIFMTHNYNNKESNIAVQWILNILLEYINMSIVFFNYFCDNLYIVNEYLLKHKDLFLIDSKCAILASMSEIILNLKQILGEEARTGEFFRNHEDLIKKSLKNLSAPKSKICIEKAYKPGMEYNQKLPASIIANMIDYFYDKKGFHIIWSIVLDSSKDKPNMYVPFEVLEVLLNFLESFRVIIDMKAFFNSELTQLKKYIYNRVNNLTENEIKVIKKEYLISCIKSFSLIISNESKSSKLAFEELYLTYFYKCLISKNLEKRIQGITAINIIIDTIDRKESYSLSIGSKLEVDEYIENLDSKGLISFFKEKNFIDVLLGENIHEEIIKRALPFFKLLAKKNCFSTSLCDQLWKIYIEKHESISIKLETIICDLSMYISEKEKQYLFNKIKLHARFCINNKMIIFIKNFTESCLKRSSANFSSSSIDFFTDERTYGLPLLWNSMQDANNSIEKISNANEMVSDTEVDKKLIKSIEIIELCVDSITELTNLNSFDDFLKQKILILCVENIKLNNSVVQSITLMRRIINNLASIKSKKIIEYLEKNHSIINHIISDFQRYIESSSNLKSNTASLSFNTVYEGFYNYKVNLETRLDFLIYLVTNPKERGRLSLCRENLEHMWILFVNGREEQNVFFEQLRRNADDLDDEAVECIFTKLMCNKEKLNFKKINLNCFNCFEKYMSNTNYNKNKMHWDSRNYRVGHEDIEGIDVIFEILFECENDMVRNKFAKLLSRVCLELKNYSENLTNKYWKNFYHKMFNGMEEAYHSKNENGIKGLIFLIKNIINDIGNPGEIPTNENINFPRDGIDYTFNHAEKNANRVVKISPSEPTYDVRSRISYFFDIPINTLRLKSKQKYIDMNDDFTVFKDSFNNNSPVEVIEHQHPILNLKNNPKSAIMTNENLIKILYELLHNSNATYIQEVWELINILPKYSELETEIGDLGKMQKPSINWNKYFDSNSIYTMSYSLKLVKNFIFSIENNKNGNIDKCVLNTEWITIFNSNKGINYLIELIFGFQIEHFKTDLGYECLNDLLYVLKNILYSFKSNPLGNERNEVVKKIIDLVNIILHSSYYKDRDEKLNELQEKFKKIKNREASFNNKFSLNNQEDEEDLNNNGNEEFCEEINKIWKFEDDTIKNLVSFLDAFEIKENVLEILLQEKNLFVEIVTFGLICPKNYKLKITLHSFINALLSSDILIKRKTFKSVLFETMFNDETLDLAGQNKETSDVFFKVAESILESNLDIDLDYKQPIGESKLDFLLLGEKMIDYIINFKSNEESDVILEGYLNILRVIILKSREISEFLMKKHNLIDLVLNKCLFSKCQLMSTCAPFPKCKSSNARYSAYRLLSAVCYNNPQNMRTILQHLNGTQDLGYWKSKKLLDWRISLSLDEKSQTGYVGLKNLGCTCYMNSLIQQLFMIPQLRESILASPDNHVGKIEESCLFQLKNIFASLKAYDGQFYNAKDFCLNFDGTSLDIREQMDVDEFYNTLIDKIENHIKDSEYQNIFKHFFGFTISDEFICKGCPHTKEKDVYFNSIQLQVLNKKSIVESLKSYVEGELLEGDNAYYCETCDKKVNALKRQCIKKLPRMLIVVLKRFDFDYENMVKIKVNDYCEFPFELNMEPFTQEYLRKSEKKSEGGIAMNEETTTETSENEEKETYSKNKPANFYKYNLSGVIIHTGTSESGHYYSIIKDYEKEQWNEFNDTIVKSYDINDLPNEAYGGTENVFNRDNKKEVLEKQTNAYLLFYKRQYEEDEIDQDVEMKPEESLNTYKEKKYKVVKTWDKFSNIIPTILDSIHTDNFQYWINKILFSKEYHSFVTDLLVNSNTYDHITKNYLTKNDNFEIEPNLYLRPSYEKTSSNMNYLQKSIKNNNVDSKMLVNNLNKNDYIFVLDKDHEMYLFKFACSFFFNVLIRAKEKYYLPAMMDVLKAFINKDDQLADWLLEEFSNYDLINEYLIESPVIDVKKLIIGLLYAAMIKSYKSKRGVNLQSNTLLIQFINNILNSIIKNSNNNDKDLSILQYILYRFALLGDETKIYLINVGVLNYLTYYYIGKNDKYAKEILLTNKDFIKANYTVPNHMELNKKLMNKVDRLSAFEELIEKKHSEKLISNRLEDYLLMTFCEIINICNINKKQTNPVYDLSKEKNAFKYLDFTNNVLINILLLEIKSKSSTVAFSKMMCNLCFNNIDHTNSFLLILIECIKQMDSYELDFTMIIFKNFLFNINDSNKDSRIKSSMVKYIQTILDCNKYWSFVEYNIDYLIKLFTNNNEILMRYFDPIKESFSKLMKYLKDYPYPPTITNNKAILMYKKKQTVYQKNLSQIQINNFITRHTHNSNEKISKLKDIYNNKLSNTGGFDNDLDLTDFKFSMNDKVKFENFNGNVLNVLDEMINIEFEKSEMGYNKRVRSQWVETDNKCLYLVELNDHSDMQIDK